MITEEDKDKLIATLTLQLQDKEKEISVLKSQLCLCQISQSIEQDKISFAVERLEKVKRELITLAGLVQFDDYYIHSKRMAQYIDNQIKAIKEME